jgi:hypothetical protein
MMVFSASMKLTHAPKFMEIWTVKLGWSEASVGGVAILELTCVALYVFPRTAVLGAVLLTAYLGGATATHVRVGESFAAPVVLGVLAWLGLYLREERLKALVPLRRS